MDEVSPPETSAKAPNACDDSPDAARPEGEAEPTPADAEQAQAEEIARLKDQLLRTLAEGENARRRALKDQEEARQYAVSAFAKDMVGVADNFRRALEALPAEGREALRDEALRNILAGIEATERQLLAALERAGVRRINPLGQAFDPHQHHVMAERPCADQPAGTVVQVLQDGYLIHGRLLREAFVAVAKPVEAD